MRNGTTPTCVKSNERAFNLRPPQPHYETMWDVAKVLNYIPLGATESLSLCYLSWKLAMILALTRLSQSTDLVNLDLSYRHFSPEGVTFQDVGITTQSRVGKPRAEFFFPAFEDATLCSMQTLQVYEQKTESLRKQGDTERRRLFLAVVKPHKPICSSKLARWQKSLLERAGVDTDSKPTR